MILCPSNGVSAIRISQNLTFIIVGPTNSEIRRLEDEWRKPKGRVSRAGDERAIAADYLNRTVPNLSSIAFLAVHRGQDGIESTILFTGDLGGDLILNGLKQADLLDMDGQLRVDILKLQHHGSKHSVDEEFFRKVIASAYVISGDGNHGNPNIDSLRWLSDASADRPIRVYLTNRTLMNNGEDTTKALDDFLDEEGRRRPQHLYFFRKPHEQAVIVKATKE